MKIPKHWNHPNKWTAWKINLAPPPFYFSFNRYSLGFRCCATCILLFGVSEVGAKNDRFTNLNVCLSACCWKQSKQFGCFIKWKDYEFRKRETLVHTASYLHFDGVRMKLQEKLEWKNVRMEIIIYWPVLKQATVSSNSRTVTIKLCLKNKSTKKRQWAANTRKPFCH